MKEVAIIEYFPDHGFEVWVTDVIKIGEGMGSVFCEHNEALKYATDQDVPILDLTAHKRPYMDEKDLQIYLAQFLEISRIGEIISIK